MSFTVGKLEDVLRSYSKDTVIHSSCGNCHHGTNGDIEIIDKTNQTYGYIEININNRHDPKIEYAADEKEFYEREIERLKRACNKHKKQEETYKRMIDSIKSDIEIYSKWLK